MRQHEALKKLVSPVVKDLGLEWVGLQYFPQGRRSLIRLYVDKPGGLTVEDCARVSRQVNALLGVEGPIVEDYTLEVSSPGLDRLLFTVEQCREQIGKLVTVRLVAPIGGKRNIKGRLIRVEKDQICIEAGGEELMLSFTNVGEARLVPEG